MPYIEFKDREHLDANERTFSPMSAGELNYAITSMFVRYVNDHGLCYQTINDIIGAAEGAKAEFQRRVVNPYEDKKIKENGDVYIDLLEDTGIIGLVDDETTNRVVVDIETKPFDPEKGAKEIKDILALDAKSYAMMNNGNHDETKD